jgi:catechol 2,3-dioxygenase-like lactoylglutathione lyase family enzyme
MNVRKMFWLGTRTDAHDHMVQFFRDVLGLRVKHAEPDFTVLAVPDGASVEVFGPTSRHNRHMTYPVAGFLVDDLDEAARELREAGVEIVLPVQRSDEGGWLHFRAPDGFIYELSEQTPKAGQS